MSIYIDEFKKIYSTKSNFDGLRAKILQLAIEGKLVPQDPTDEPASVLIKKIKVEIEQLIKDKKMKKPAVLEPILEDEIPFEIPDNWEWMRLGNVISITSGDGLTSKNMAVDGDYKVYGGNGITGYHNECNVSGNTIVIGRVGYYCGSVHLTPERAWVTDNAFITTFPSNSINRKWLIQTLKTMDLGRNDYSTAQPVISQGKIYPYLMPIPPLEEQKRIVEKVEVFMSLIDVMKEKVEKSERLQKQLPKSIVEAIGICETEHQLKEQLEFVIENFEEIFQTPESMQDLRNVILQLAIEGKLVPQDPSDEPTSVLLEKIKTEKEQLLDDKKIKRTTNLGPISDDEIPFEIPDSWEWVRLGEIKANENYSFADGPFGSNLKKSHYTSQGVRIIQLSNIGDGFWRNENEKYTSISKADELIRCNCYPGDLVIAKMMPSGRTCIVPENNLRYVLASDSVKFRPYHEISKIYIMHMMNSPGIRKSISFDATGITRTRTSLGKLQNLYVPLAPANEQIRIVEKVKSLMGIIDHIEEKLELKVQIIEKLGSA